jgi:hypothetical protein
MISTGRKIKDLGRRAYWKIAGIPHVTTIHGHERCDALEKREGSQEDERAKIDWIEYHLDGELVHRSVNIALKQGIDLSIIQRDLN